MNERPFVHLDLRIAQLAASQHGLASIDQLRRLGLGRGALDHRLRTGQALTGGTMKIGDLRETAKRRGGRPGGAQVRRLLDAFERHDSLTRSELEEAFLRLVRCAQLPSPSLNALLHGHRVDAVWPDRRVRHVMDAPMVTVRAGGSSGH